MLWAVADLQNQLIRSPIPVLNSIAHFGAWTSLCIWKNISPYMPYFVKFMDVILLKVYDKLLMNFFETLDKALKLQIFSTEIITLLIACYSIFWWSEFI